MSSLYGKRCVTGLYLIEEHIFSISSFCCKIFQITIFADSVFLTELLPELGADFDVSFDKEECTVVAALAGLDCDELSDC